MEKSFANLLRQSRLASYDRTLEQVYTSPKRFRKMGDWGLKRNLPTVIRTKFVEIGGLDTAEHQTPWESGDSKVLFLKRWKENFPNSHKPTPRSEQVQYNAANMTPAEFQRLLREAAKKADDFQSKLAKKEVVPEQVFDYLHVNFAETTENTGGGVVGPTYSDHEVGWNYPVEGRVLNVDHAGFAVGIGGVVAHMAKRNALGFRNTGDRTKTTFYVNKAEIDDQGKPKVQVSLRSKADISSIPALNSYDEYDTVDTGSRNTEHNTAHMSVSEMMNARRRTPRVETEDNITPNPEHTELMARIASLLDGSKGKQQ